MSVCCFRFTMETRKRNHETNEEFFVPSVFSEEKLPTKADVLKYYLYLKNKDPNVTDSEVSKLVIDKVLFMWGKTTIPTIQYKSAVNETFKFILAIHNIISTYDYFHF